MKTFFHGPRSKSVDFNVKAGSIFVALGHSTEPFLEKSHLSLIMNKWWFVKNGSNLQSEVGLYTAQCLVYHKNRSVEWNNENHQTKQFGNAVQWRCGKVKIWKLLEMHVVQLEKKILEIIAKQNLYSTHRWANFSDIGHVFRCCTM